MATLRHKRKANLSRKQIFDVHRKNYEKKKKVLDEAKKEERRQKMDQIRTVKNKASHRSFDRALLTAVQTGLTSAIETLGEKVQPLSVYMTAFTALSNVSDRRHIPYLLSIIAGCIPKLSQGVLHHETNKIFRLSEQLLAESIHNDSLTTTKTIMLLQSLMLSFEHPTLADVQSFAKLQPSSGNQEAAELFLMSFRKFLEQLALTVSPNGPARKDDSNLYALNPSQLLFTDAAPLFVDLCVKNLTAGGPAQGSVVTFFQLSSLWDRVLSPYIVESVEGQRMINQLLSHQFLTLMKPAYQHVWPMGVDMLQVFCGRLNYLKRVDTDGLSFTDRFPPLVFLVKVLHKLRNMNDAALNGKVERCLISIAKGMTVSEFTGILPFDPRVAYEAEASGEDSTALWATSYTLDVIRRSCSHDSLPFFKEHFFPLIQFCSRQAVEAERAGLQEEFLRWSALLTQYWRVTTGFFHFPLEITDESFRDVAKQLVGLLSNPSFVDTSATAIHIITDSFYSLSQQEESELMSASDDEDEEARKVSSNANRRSGFDKTALNDDLLFLSLNDPSWSPHVFHNISKEKAQWVCQSILSKYSSNIMPKLCNVFENHDSMAVLQAIQSFSKVCHPDVMAKILKGILDVGSSIANDINDKQEIYMGAAKMQHAPLSSKRRMVLDIACAIVPQLSAEDITQLFGDVIEPVIMDPTPESRLLQKKAYKLLLSIFEHRVKDILNLLPRVIGLLSVGRQFVTISAMKMRLRCLSWVLDTCKMFYPDDMLVTVRATVGEIVAFARERSQETRNLTMNTLEKMQSFLTVLGHPVSTLLHMVVVGLAGGSATMISSTIVCMAKLIYLTHESLSANDLNSSVALCIQLMESNEPEVRTAASIFARMALKLAKRFSTVMHAVQLALPKILFAIALTTSQPRVSSNVRLEMRVLLEKVIKRFGYEEADKLFPLGSKNFLRYTQKMMKREDKKAERELKVKQRKQDDFEKFFLNASMKADEAEDDLLETGALSSFVSMHTAPALPGSGMRYDTENDEDGLQVSFVDGKLIIDTVEERKQLQERERRLQMSREARRLNPTLSGESLTTGAARPGKRVRSEIEDFENEELVLRYGTKAGQEKAEAESATIRRDNQSLNAAKLQKLRTDKEDKRATRRLRVEEDIRKGEEFKGAGIGDVKRGNVDPYAYIPLNRRYMNRRHARQSLHRFEVVSHTQLKGEKAKMSESMRKS